MNTSTFHFTILLLIFVLLFSFDAEAQVTLSADTTSGCAPLTVNFQVNAPGASGYIWNFGDSTTSTVQNPGRIYTQGGTFIVSVTILYPSQAPNVMTLSTPITVFEKPDAGFSGLPLLVCKGDPIQFTDTSRTTASPIATWLWSFGDGSIATVANPVHRYMNPGFYNVSLAVENSQGCKDLAFKTGYVRVNGPDASFNYDNSLACNPPLRVNFTHQGGSVASHSWDFGDGNTSTQQNPSNRYTTNGVFTVTHIVFDNFGCSDTVTYNNLINVGQASVQVTAIPNQICPGDTVDFLCGSTNAISTNWNFGPGQGTSTLCNVQHSFTAPGNYPVTLTLTDNNNCTLTGTTNILVNPLPVPDFFSPNLVTCSPPHTANFTNTSAALPGTTWLWNFGFGTASQSAMQNPSYTYTTPGLYSIKLIATDPNGCIDSLEKPLYIDVGYIGVNAAAIPDRGCKPLFVQFNNVTGSNSPIISSKWYFGDGDSSLLTNPTHTYLDTGYYNVKLVVENANGCKDSAVFNRFVRVGDSVHADFSYQDTIVCAKDSIPFLDLSTGNIDDYRWYFGDGGSYFDSINVTHTFIDTGFMTVTHIVMDRGCADTLEIDSAVYIMPSIAAFSGNFIGCDTPHTVNFVDRSKGADVWHWDFGTGNPADTSNLQNPTFTYTQLGTYVVTLWTTNIATGCYFEESHTVQIQLVDALFTVDTLSGCSPLTVNFRDFSLNPATWVWRFGDGGVATWQHTSHTYTTPGIYNPTLTVWNSIGCKDIFTGPTITVMKPVIDFVVLDTNVCAPVGVPFVNLTTSIAPVTSWVWNFGTGPPDSTQSPTFTYTLPGHYTISLTATDSAGCTSSFTKQQYVYVQETIADFQIDFPVNCIDNPIKFTNNSSSQSPITYLWDLGDNTFPTVWSPTHSYQANGWYPVSLIVADTIGCIDTMVQIVTIADPDIGMLADTTWGPCPPLLVQFTGLVNSVHNFTNWQWDLGNGMAAIQNPINLYTAPGNYTVSVVATSDAGCSDTVEIQDYIQIGGPSGVFSHTPKSGCPGQMVTFTASTNQATFNQWDFGDGNLSPASGLDTLITHVYRDTGTFYPVMILDDGMGCRISVPAQDSVVIYPNPNVNFAALPSVICDSGQVQFQDLTTSSTPLASWSWDFGDATGSVFQNPGHFYSVPDTYQVKLIVTTAFGCVDSLAFPAVTVHLSPKAAIGLSDTVGCMPFSLTVTDLTPPTYAPVQSWLWDFGYLGNTSNQSTDNFLYPAAGRYTVNLEVTDVNGCQSVADTSVRALPLPQVDFRANDSVGCAPVTLQFTDLTPDAVAWFWDFGDNNTSTLPNPIHTYNQDNVYTVSLTVTDSRGCENTLTKPQYIRLAHPTADFSAAPREGCPGLEVFFTDFTTTDTSIVRWEWNFGDNQTGIGNSPSHIYNQPGTYSIQLIVTDVFGCMDTVFKPDYIRVRENIQPDTPELTYVSVLADNRIEVRWQQFANPLGDFDRYVISKKTQGGVFQPVYTSTNIGQVVFYDTAVNTQTQVYCYMIQVVNDCENFSLADESKMHCTVLLSTFPQVDAAELTWTPYIGWPVVDAYRIYRVVDYNPARAVLLATVAGDVTTYMDSAVFCYESYTYRIMARFGGTFSWSNIREETPIHFPSEKQQNMVRATVMENQWVQVEWDFPEIPQGREVLIERDAGAGYRTLHRQPYTDPATFYEDRNTSVDKQPYRYRASVLDSCGDYTPLGRDATSIFLSAKRKLGRVTLIWTGYETWKVGVEYYQLQVFDELSGTYENVARIPGTTLGYLDETTNLKQGSYCYRVIAHELGGGTDTTSTSNEACVLVDPNLYGPNAFTPNNDGINDEFLIKGIYMDTYHLQIFSRWGYAIFESTDITEGWDGTYKGKAVPEGVYVYVVRGTGFEGQEVELRGTVTLVR